MSNLVKRFLLESCGLSKISEAHTRYTDDMAWTITDHLRAIGHQIVGKLVNRLF